MSGDVINTAARLRPSSGGGILVGEQTHRATERVIDYAEHPAVPAKGKAKPVAACWRCVATPATAWARRCRPRCWTRARGAAHRCAGTRSQRRAAAADHPRRRPWDRQEPARRRAVGRRLRRPRPDHVASGRSLPYGEGVAYWALGEIVKAWGILESTAPTSRRRSSRQPSSTCFPIASRLRRRAAASSTRRPRGPDGQPSRDEAFAGRRRFLEALAEQRPTVLVFEDLHWADDDFWTSSTSSSTTWTPSRCCSYAPHGRDRSPAGLGVGAS